MFYICNRKMQNMIHFWPILYIYEILHTIQIFARCMLLVVVIGMIHGMLVMPVIFALLDTVPRKLTAKSRKQHLASTVTVVTVVT